MMGEAVEPWQQTRDSADHEGYKLSLGIDSRPRSQLLIPGYQLDIRNGGATHDSRPI